MRIGFDRADATVKGGSMPIVSEHPRARPRPSRQAPGRPSGLTERHYLDLGRTQSMICRHPRRPYPGMPRA
jgi:hypothetical protein